MRLIHFNIFQAGQCIDTVTVMPTPKRRVLTPLKRVKTISAQQAQQQGGVIIECVRPQARKGMVRTRALSKGFNSKWY